MYPELYNLAFKVYQELLKKYSMTTCEQWERATKSDLHLDIHLMFNKQIIWKQIWNTETMQKLKNMQIYENIENHAHLCKYITLQTLKANLENTCKIRNTAISPPYTHTHTKHGNELQKIETFLRDTCWTPWWMIRKKK